MSQVTSFMFSSVALVSFTMFRVPFGLSQLCMVHLAQKKELVYMNHMNWPQKQRITIKLFAGIRFHDASIIIITFPLRDKEPDQTESFSTSMTGCWFQRTPAFITTKNIG